MPTPVIPAETAGRASIAIRTEGSEDLDLALVAEHQAVHRRRGLSPADLDVLAEERLREAPHVLDPAALHDDRVLDLAPADGAVVVDRGVRPDQVVLDHRVLSDDRRTADDRARYLRAPLDHHRSHQP